LLAGQVSLYPQPTGMHHTPLLSARQHQKDGPGGAPALLAASGNLGAQKTGRVDFIAFDPSAHLLQEWLPGQRTYRNIISLSTLVGLPLGQMIAAGGPGVCLQARHSPSAKTLAGCTGPGPMPDAWRLSLGVARQGKMAQAIAQMRRGRLLTGMHPNYRLAAPLDLDLLATPRVLTLARGQTHGPGAWVPGFGVRRSIGVAGRLGPESICRSIDYLGIGANPFVAHFAAHTSGLSFEGSTLPSGALVMRARISHNLDLFELIAGKD
jgi:hypothetical protein